MFPVIFANIIVFNNTIAAPFIIVLLLPYIFRIDKAPKIFLLNYVFCIVLMCASFWGVILDAGYDQDIFYVLKALISFVILGMSALLFNIYPDSLWSMTRSLIIFQGVLFLASFIPLGLGQWSGDTYIGLFSNRNTFSFVFTIAFAVLLCSYVITRKKIDMVLALVAFGFVVLSGARAALGCSLVSSLVFSFLFQQKKLAVSLGISLGSVLTFSLVNHLDRARALFSAITFDPNAANTSERLDVWRSSLSLILENPLWGLGFYKTGDFVRLGTHAHNVFLQFISDFGVFGLPFLATIFYPLVKSRWVFKSPLIFVWLSVILYSLVTLPTASPASVAMLGALIGLCISKQGRRFSVHG